MADLTCDVAVIGAGTAGIAAERSARKNGAKTLLIDPYFAGTVCASVGCMPSKLLIAAAHAAHSVRQAPQFGVHSNAPDINGRQVMDRVRTYRDQFVQGTKDGFEALPDGVAIKARARFTGPTTLELDDGRRVNARAIIIATGSAPMVPEPFQDLGPRVLTNQTVFELETLPRRLAVIGGGPIGLELAQAMGRLDVDTHLFDHDTRLGKVRCDAVHAALHTAVSRDVTLHLGTDIVPQAATDAIHLSWTGAQTGAQDFDYVLLATGRPPQLAGLDLGASGLDLDDHGTPVFDPHTLQCGDAPVFIAGDANAHTPILHEASNEGAIAGRNAVAYPASIPSQRSVPFSMIFTDPPVVTLGASMEDSVVTGVSDYSNQGRAKVEAVNEGTVRLHAAAPEGRLVGADLCCPGGEHLGHLLAWAIMQRMTASDLLSMPFYHPTLEEGLRNALRDICHATPIPLPGDHDEQGPPGT
ncbi:dihydrolipoyl dehydrogenase [Rhodobacteraceae bacterium]|nr:dihydrolipoyl dehydrogenase [Paracoccaceae bacterium]